MPAARGLTALRPILATKGIPSEAGSALLGISVPAHPAVSGCFRLLTVGVVGAARQAGTPFGVRTKSPVGLRDNAQSHWAFALTGPRQRR